MPNTLSYYLNARYIYFGGWIYGQRDFNPSNVSYTDSAKNYILYRDEEGIGDGEYIPMNWNRKLVLQGKLIYNISPVMKLFYNYIRDDVEFEEYDRNYKLNPDGNLNKFRTGDSHILKFTHTLSPSTYYDLGGSFFAKEYKQYVYEDRFDTRYVHPKITDNQQQYSFLSGGTKNQHFQRKTETTLFKLDLTSQINDNHLIKIGGEARLHDIFFEDITLRPLSDELNLATGNPFMYQGVPRSELEIPGIETPYYSTYTRNPREFSVYIQDKMEFDDLIVNLGIRFDHFQPDGVILADPTDPNIYRPIKPENRYEDANGNGVYDPGEKIYTPEDRAAWWYLDAKDKTQISPRLGVSFPVTETGVVHFSYGHFFQIPNFELLYRNPQFKLESGTGNIGIIGNADLDPEYTISGEIGLQQQIGSNVILDLTAYFRDIRDLTGTRAEEIVIFGGSSSYSRLANSDFGFVKGIILSLKNRYGSGFNYSIDYTFQVANGTASDENQAQLALAAGNQPEVQLVPLSWDQLHTLNATTSYIAETWGLSLIGNFGSGLPYTPRSNKDVSALNENSASKPVSWNVDMRLHKDFRLFANRFTLFLRVFNLFDNLNHLDVYKDSGKADFTTELERVRRLNPFLPINTLDEWYNDVTYYSEPRRIELGFMYNF